MKKNFILTKTKYVLFLQCPKSLWLNENSQHKKVNNSAFDVLKMEEGHIVGKLATTHPLYSDGVLIDTLNPEKAIQLTKENLENPNVKFIYEAAFLINYENQDCFVRVDILEKTTNGLAIIEVKSSTKPKPEYLSDIAFQKWVIEQSGHRVVNSALAYINKQYIFKNSIDLKEYFNIEDVSEQLDSYSSKINENVVIIKKIMEIKNEPEFETGPHCNSPHPCSFKDYCLKEIPIDSIENLRNLHYKKKEILKKENILSMKEISSINMLNFTDTQQIQILCSKTPNVFHLEKEKVSNYIKTLKYPLHFLDFEALLTAIPYFNGMKPQQFVVYQASIHKLAAPNKKLEHAAYLHEELTDPRLKILEFLKSNINDNGSIIVYHQQFEETQLTTLKRDFPDYACIIDSWISRLWDLEKIFSNFWFHDLKQEGSTSIKYVFPVLVPKLSYQNLYIKDGNSSVAYYLKMLNSDTCIDEKEFLKLKLVEYNNLDTLAMAKILSKIKWIVNKKDVA